MATMIYDWMTAGVLRPLLKEEGLGLADHARAVRDALSGTYQDVSSKALGRRVGVSDFATFHVAASRVAGVSLMDPKRGGDDPFASAVDRGAAAPIRGLPPMWGSVVRDGDRYQFKPSGIALDRSLVLLPSEGGGMAMFGGVLPEVVMPSMPGQPFRRIVRHPHVDPLELVVRRIREASSAEIANLGVLLGSRFEAWRDHLASGSSVATFRNDKTPLRVVIPD